METLLRPLGLTIPQYACMHLLHESPGISGAELARRAFVTRQAVYLVLAELRDLGWVTRESRGSGVRQGAAHLTATGRAVVESAFGPVAEIEDVMTVDLSAAEAAMLSDLLARCEAALKRLNNETA
jgi:DNA-binding MarR family transcriptional regulator